jgi:hypothetical protein
MADHGGKREGAGRPRSLPEEARWGIAHEYLQRVELMEFAKIPRPWRERAIQEIVAEHKVSRRMVVRCINEFRTPIVEGNKDFRREKNARKIAKMARLKSV